MLAETQCEPVAARSAEEEEEEPSLPQIYSKVILKTLGQFKEQTQSNLASSYLTYLLSPTLSLSMTLELQLQPGDPHQLPAFKVHNIVTK